MEDLNEPLFNIDVTENDYDPRNDYNILHIENVYEFSMFDSVLDCKKELPNGSILETTYKLDKFHKLIIEKVK